MEPKRITEITGVYVDDATLNSNISFSKKFHVAVALTGQADSGEEIAQDVCWPTAVRAMTLHELTSLTYGWWKLLFT